MRKTIYIVIGFICVALGALGVVLPILPTTPFLLLATWFFARSSDRLNEWFKSTSLYKNNLESFVNGHGMTKKTKIKIISTVTILMAVAFFTMKSSAIGRFCVGIVWIAHIIVFLLFIDTCEDNDNSNRAYVGTDISEGMEEQEEVNT